MNEVSLTAERLRELLLDLEYSQQRERELRGQSEALLAGVKALTEATTPEDLFAKVLDALRQPLAFDHAFVLRSSRDPNTLHATAATNPSFVGTRWTIGKSFARILQAGRVVVHLDTALVGEWREQSAELRELAGSAICIPLRGTSETALLVCTRAEPRGFQPAQEQMAKRFQPLATQALRDAERVTQIERANYDMRLVLASVDQGLLTIDRDANIVGEMSGAVTAWFGAIEPGTWLPSVLGRVRPADGEAFEMGWSQIVDDVLPLSVAIACMPSRITTDGQTLALQLRPIGSIDTWTRMLVVISDVTAVIARERAEERRRELAAVVTRIVRDRTDFQIFWDEASAMVDQLVSGAAADRIAQLRLLHTLKGNSGSVGLDSVARACHELEERALEETLSLDEFAMLTERWQALAEEISPVLGGPTPPIAISEDEHEWLMDALDRSAAPPEVSRTVGSWVDERVEIPLDRLADQARRLAERLDKPGLDVRVIGNGVRYEAARYRPFFAALVHAIRNAIDHGIESPQQRESAGKPRGGRLTLAATTSAEALVISVEDDGPGVDWSRVAARAASLGVPHASKEDLVDALLSDGLSTRDDVSEISGRGVGMSALRASVESLGGTITIDSTVGRGTVVRCTFRRLVPRAAVAVARSSSATRGP